MIDPFLKRRKPLSRFPKRRGEVRVGKLGIVRLKGAALMNLRYRVFVRDLYHCRDCGMPCTWESGHMAHIISRGAGGSDSEDNCRLLCMSCHVKEHNCGGKPLPAKEK